MNEIISKCLLNGDKRLRELRLKQPGFTYSSCGAFTKRRERFQKFRETGHVKHLYAKELGKAYFTHDAAYCACKNLAKRTISDKVLKGRAYEIARNCNYDGYQRALASIVYTFFDKKKKESGISVAQELHEPIIKKPKERKVYARFKENIWAADLAEMRLLSSKSKNVKYLLCVIDVTTKHALR